HEHADRIPPADAVLLEHAGIAVRERVELPPGQLAPLEQQCRTVRVSGRRTLHEPRDAVPGIRRSRLHLLLQREQSRYLREGFRDVDETHGFPLPGTSPTIAAGVGGGKADVASLARRPRRALGARLLPQTDRSGEDAMNRWQIGNVKITRVVELEIAGGT